jgi:tetratricopeptide (TPR) repeat protein
MARNGVAPIVLSSVAALLVGTLACAGRGPGEVSPQEIPNLEARVAREPGNAALQSRYAAALFAANRCDAAQEAAGRALALKADDAVATLIAGQCLEKAGQYDQAIERYARFSSAHANARGAAAIRARELLARRAQATAGARAALLREQELAQQPADPQTVAVLPVEIVGDSSYQPLSRGLAQMLISDLALLQRFRMVERVQLGALMDELRFSQTARVDPATAARVGRLVQAGRMVQGLATIPRTGPVRLQATLVQGSGEVADAGEVSGNLRGLLQLEKDLVVQLAGRMGYTLSEAERRRILENGTQNLQAFLAYSRGLLAEDAGDFSRAALYFGEAVQADPGFQAAREQQQASAAAPAVQQGGTQVATVVAQTGVQAPAPPQVPNALGTAVGDLAATQSEQNASGTRQTTQQAGTTTTSQPPPTTREAGTTDRVTGTVNIKFPLP